MQCKYYNHPGGCTFGDDCKYSHSANKTFHCIYFKKGYCKFGGKCGFIHDHKMISPSYYELAIEEEMVGCAMSPNWQRACIEMKTSLESYMNPWLIQIVIDYYGLAPIMENFAAYFSPPVDYFGDIFIVTKWPFGKNFNSCFICCEESPEKELMLAFHRCFAWNEKSHNSIKMRKICQKCWSFKPEDLKDGKLNIDWNAKKVTSWECGRLVPQNNSARAAFLCISKWWRIYKAADCEWFRTINSSYVIKDALKWVPLF